MDLCRLMFEGVNRKLEDERFERLGGMGLERTSGSVNAHPERGIG